MPSKLSNKKLARTHSLLFEAIGTRWTIETYDRLPDKTIATLLDCIQKFDQKWSRFRAESLTTQLSRDTGILTLDSDEYEMLVLYRKFYDLTNGAVTPLAGQLLADSGYDAAYSLQPKELRRPAPAWDETLSLTPNSLRILRPALLDIGAAGKGLLVDRIVRLVSKVQQYFTVDAGGDMYVFGHQEQIALEHPGDPTRAIGIATVANQALCGSAPNRRAWRDLHHILDPRSTKPVTDTVATWAIADTAVMADIVTTALFFITPEQVRTIVDCDCIAMYPAGHVRYSKSSRIELYV